MHQLQADYERDHQRLNELREMVFRDQKRTDRLEWIAAAMEKDVGAVQTGVEKIEECVRGLDKKVDLISWKIGAVVTVAALVIAPLVKSLLDTVLP